MSSVGEREQERAFMEWWLRYSQQVYVSAPPRKGWVVDVARAAFAAGEKRGQEPSCCHAHPGNGRLAVRERDD